MPRNIHVAVARVYASPSSYGDTPFQSPAHGPKVVCVGDETLEVHFGSSAALWD
jgi:hypothetical protein